MAMLIYKNSRVCCSASAALSAAGWLHNPGGSGCHRRHRRTTRRTNVLLARCSLLLGFNAIAGCRGLARPRLRRSLRRSCCSWLAGRLCCIRCEILPSASTALLCGCSRSIRRSRLTALRRAVPRRPRDKALRRPGPLQLVLAAEERQAAEGARAALLPRTHLQQRHAGAACALLLVSFFKQPASPCARAAGREQMPGTWRGHFTALQYRTRATKQASTAWPNQPTHHAPQTLGAEAVAAGEGRPAPALLDLHTNNMASQRVKRAQYSW